MAAALQVGYRCPVRSFDPAGAIAAREVGLFKISDIPRRIVSLQLRVQQKLSRWGISGKRILIGMSFLVGILAGTAAWLFKRCLQSMHTLYFSRLVDSWHVTTRWPALLLLPLIPAVGGLILVAWRWFFNRHRRSVVHGLSGILYSLNKESGRLPSSLGAETLVASSITIASGGSAGPEAPIAVIGASVGSLLGRITGVSNRYNYVLIGCGAAAGISAVFAAPLSGVVFATEVVLQDFSAATLTPIVISSVMATLTYVGLSGGGEVRGLFQMPRHAEKFNFTFHVLPWFLLLGVICGLVGVAFTRLLTWSEQLHDRLHRFIPGALHPAIGGLLCGLCGLVIVGLFIGDPFLHSRFTAGYIPIFGDGYPTIHRIIDPAWYNGQKIFSGRVETISLEFLIAVCVLKLLATCFTLGSGGSGGIFAPSLFLGAAVGGAFGVVLKHFVPDAEPSTFALVGMGATLAAAIQAPLTGIFLLFELTRNYNVMPPIMLAAVTATVIQQLFIGESIYTLPLKKMGVRLGSAVGISALRRVTIDQLPLETPHFARTDETLSQVLARSTERGVRDFVVVDSGNRYVGLLTLDDLKNVLLAPEAAPLLLVTELVRADIPPLEPTATLEDALDVFNRYDTPILPVVGPRPTPDSPPIAGVLSRTELMRRSGQELGGG